MFGDVSYVGDVDIDPVNILTGSIFILENLS